MINHFSKWRVSNETRAQRRCFWGHVFEAGAAEISRCPQCGSATDFSALCEVCGIAFIPRNTGAGGRQPFVCSTRCRVRKHRVTKLGPKGVKK